MKSKVSIYGNDVELNNVTIEKSDITNWDKLLLITTDELNVSSVNELKTFITKISDGGIVIWIGTPFKRIKTNSLTSAKEIKNYLEKLNLPLGIEDIYIGYKDTYFVEIKQKYDEVESSTCEETEMSSLTGVVPYKEYNGVPLGENVIPYMICMSDKGKYTPSYSILLDKGQILRPFTFLNDEKKLVLLSLIKRLIKQIHLDEISSIMEKVTKEMSNDSTFLELYTQAVTLYYMGYYSASGVILRNLLEAIIVKKYRDPLCKIYVKFPVNKGDKLDILNNFCNSNPPKRTIYDFTKIIEDLLVYAKNVNIRKIDLELIRKYANESAHFAVAEGLDISADKARFIIYELPRTLNNLNELVKILENEGNNSSRLTS